MTMHWGVFSYIDLIYLMQFDNRYRPGLGLVSTGKYSTKTITIAQTDFLRTRSSLPVIILQISCHWSRTWQGQHMFRNRVKFQFFTT